VLLVTEEYRYRDESTDNREPESDFKYELTEPTPLPPPAANANRLADNCTYRAPSSAPGAKI
jgi:hypothetical protein